MKWYLLEKMEHILEQIFLDIHSKSFIWLKTLAYKEIQTTKNYYISSTDETRKNVTDSYENAINLDVIDINSYLNNNIKFY